MIFGFFINSKTLVFILLPIDDDVVKNFVDDPFIHDSHLRSFNNIEVKITVEDRFVTVSSIKTQGRIYAVFVVYFHRDGQFVLQRLDRVPRIGCCRRSNTSRRDGIIADFALYQKIGVFYSTFQTRSLQKSVLQRHGKILAETWQIVRRIVWEHIDFHGFHLWTQR